MDVGGFSKPKTKTYSKGTILNFLTKSRNTGMHKNGGGYGNGNGIDGRRSVGMAMDPKDGIKMTKLTKNSRSSACLGRKKVVLGAKSKTGKGPIKKLGWSDSSQPGIRKFLHEIMEIKTNSNGNSLGIKKNSFKNQ